MNLMLIGAIALSCFLASLFFIRFWRATRDRFFLYFAFSFFIEGCNRLMLGSIAYSSEEEPLFYLIRLFAFTFIIIGIMDKNGKRKIPRDDSSA